MNAGYELSLSGDGRGDGVFATRSFQAGETVMVGEIERPLPRNHSHATQVGLTEYVELAGLGSKVNHSCNPNCGIRVNEAGAPDLVARQNIPSGEEITFDYAMRNYSIEHFPSRCRCGAARCRGSVTGWKDLPEECKAQYRGFVAPYLLELGRQRALRHPSQPQDGHERFPPTNTTTVSVAGAGPVWPGSTMPRVQTAARERDR